MPTSQRMFLPFEQLFTNLGAIGAGWKIYTYETGTSTPKVTYTTSALNVANTNPVVADANGRVTNMFVARTNLYKAVLTDENDVVIATRDPVDSLSFSLADFNPQPTSFWGTTAGTSSAYTLASNPGIMAYSSNDTFFVIFHTANVAGATLSIDGLAARTLQKQTGAGTLTNLENNDVVNAVYLIKDNGVTLTVLNPEINQSLKANNFTANTTLNGALLAQKRIIISNNGSDANNDIDFAAGVAFDKTNSVVFNLSAITKRLDAAWAAGTNQGGLDTGVEANSTWYHCYAIFNPTTGVSDALFSTNASSPTLPSGYTRYARVGSIYNNSGGNILAFTQVDDVFTLTVSVLDVNGVNQLTTETSRTLTVPLGINVDAFGSAFVSATAAGNIFIKIYAASMSMAVLAASNGQLLSTNGTHNGTGYWRAVTNTSSQVKTNGAGSTGSTSFTMYTDGWRDLGL